MASLNYRNKEGEMTKLPQYIMISNEKIRGQVDAFMAENLEKEISNGVNNFVSKDNTLVKASEFDAKVNAYLPQNETFQGLVKSSPSWKNVKEYGVAGDGVTDDTEALQAILDNAKTGDTIYFPTGRYLISGGLTINRKQITLKGDNSGNWNFNSTNWTTGEKIPSASIIVVKDGVSDITALTITGTTTNSDVVIENIKFTSSSFKFAQLTELPEIGTPAEVYSCTVVDENVNGIYVDTANMKFSQVTLINVNVTGFSGIGAQLGNTGRTVGFTALYCNTAIKTGIDNTLQYTYITMCNAGINVTKNTIFAYGLWIDMVNTYAIYSDGDIAGELVGTIDHIGYAGIKCKTLQQMNLKMRINRCGGYYHSVTEENITDYDKACLIYATNGNNNVLDITFDATKNWVDDGEESARTCSQYGVVGQYWNENTVTLGSKNIYAPYKIISSDSKYKLYAWKNNIFNVAGKTYQMDGKGLILKDDSCLPSKNTIIDTFGEFANKHIKGTFPRRVVFNLAKATTVFKIFGSDNSFLHTLTYNENMTKNGGTITVNPDYSFGINGTVTAWSNILVFGATATNDNEVTLASDLYVHRYSVVSGFGVTLYTSAGNVALNDDVQVIPSGTVLYGMAISMSAGTYKQSTVSINASYTPIETIDNTFKKEDNTVATVAAGSKISYENDYWYVDGVKLNAHNKNNLNDFFQKVFEFENPCINGYYSNLTSIEMEYSSLFELNQAEEESFNSEMDALIAGRR